MATFDPNNPYQQEVLGLDRQRQLSQMLLQQGMQQPQGQMVSGRFVAPAITERLANLLSVYGGQKGLADVEKKQLELAQKLRGEQTRLGKEYIGAMQGKQAVYEPDIPTETYETVKGKMISPATGPNYQQAFEIANDPLAPAWAKAQAAELIKPRVFKEGETFNIPSFAGGEVKFTQTGGGGMVLPSDLKSIAIRLGLPTDSSKWTDEQRKLVDITAKAEKGPPVTNLTVNTGKAYTGAFGEGIAKEDLGKYSIAEKAPAIYQNALNTEQLLNKGAITGLGAEYKLNLARAFNVAGANNNEIIKNTEQLVANRGQIVLDSIKASGLGAGQGFTDKDRQFLEKVKGGTIELNSNTLRELARIEKSVAQSAIDTWNKRLPNIPKEAIQGTGIGPIQLQSGGRVVDFNSLPK